MNGGEKPLPGWWWRAAARSIKGRPWSLTCWFVRERGNACMRERETERERGEFENVLNYAGFN